MAVAGRTHISDSQKSFWCEKQHFKRPPAYDGTFRRVVKEEDDGDKVTEKSQHELIDAARDELNETSLVMVDGNFPEVLY